MDWRKYTLDEFSVVVLGVLAAFWVESWKAGTLNEMIGCLKLSTYSLYFAT